MDKRGNPPHDEWPLRAAGLINEPVQLDLPLVPEMPHDGRSLPDVDLDRLVEAVLRNLTGRRVENGSRSLPEAKRW